MHLQPLLLGAGAQKAFEIAARMQPHAAPVGGGEDRRLDVLELRQPRLVVVVDQPVAQRVAVAVGAVFFELRSRRASQGPRPVSPVTALLAPRSPTPFCTAVTWRGYQVEQKSDRMPPWRHSSR